MTEGNPSAEMRPSPIRPEEHVRLALAMAHRVFRRPTDDDRGEALVALVEAAAQWNAGKRPCRWSTFAGSRIRWDLLYRFQLASAASIRAEVPLFLSGKDDDEVELERPEIAVEDRRLRQLEARADVAALLAGLEPRERYVLERRFGIRGEAATCEAIGREIGVTREAVRQVERKAIGRLRKRARRGTFTIPLDSSRAERLR